MNCNANANFSVPNKPSFRVIAQLPQGLKSMLFYKYILQVLVFFATLEIISKIVSLKSSFEANNIGLFSEFRLLVQFKLTYRCNVEAFPTICHWPGMSSWDPRSPSCSLWRMNIQLRGLKFGWIDSKEAVRGRHIVFHLQDMP